MVKKLFHDNPKLNLQELSCFCGLLGKEYPKYLGSLKPECIKFFTHETGSGIPSVPLGMRGVGNSIRHLNIDKTDKENLIKIVNSLINPKSQDTHSTTVRGLYSLFKDHFDMIEKIRDYDPNMKMRASNYPDFHTEQVTGFIKPGLEQKTQIMIFYRSNCPGMCTLNETNHGENDKMNY